MNLAGSRSAKRTRNIHLQHASETTKLALVPQCTKFGETLSNMFSKKPSDSLIQSNHVSVIDESQDIILQIPTKDGNHKV